MKIGAHLSIGKGFAAMARAATMMGCEAVQVFSRSPRGGVAKILDPLDISKMKTHLEQGDVEPLVVHVPYFVNLCSDNVQTYDYSIEVICQEISRAEMLGAKYVITHFGHGNAGEAEKNLIVRAISTILDRTKDSKVGLLLENAAGQGKEMGYRFSEIAEVIRLVRDHQRLGICLDTCHAFAAGYDVTTVEGIKDTLSDIGESLGLERLRLVHANDSKTDLGSRIDRHEHIGRGKIGESGFEALVDTLKKALSGLSPLVFIIETPVDNADSNLVNVRTLKNIRERLA